MARSSPPRSSPPLPGARAARARRAPAPSGQPPRQDAAADGDKAPPAARAKAKAAAKTRPEAPAKAAKSGAGKGAGSAKASGPGALASREAVGRWGEREAGILAVALELFRKEGYEKCSMARVAAAAGLSEGTLYNYFRDKTDLVLRVMLVALELRVAAAIRAVDECATLREGLQKLIALHLAAIVENEETYRIWVREVRTAKTFRRSAARDALSRFANQFVRLLDKFGYTNDDPGGLPRVFMREMVFGGSEHIGFTAMVQRRADRIDVEAAAAKMADIYIRGFGLEPTAG